MKQRYEEKYHKEKHSHLYNDEEYYLIRSRIAKHDYFNISFFDDINLCSILDYGGGLGQNTFLFKDVVVYDKSKFAVEFCKKKGKKSMVDLDKIKKNHFDIVFSAEVLEHLENPLEELKQMLEKLNENGILILILPIDKWNKPNIYDKNQHLYNWNFNTITNLLVRAGFYPIDYKIIRRTGFYKLLPFSRINFDFYLFLTKLAAIIYGSKHMRIVAVKENVR
jgi:SAM-dependent methyltransferase